VVAIFANGSDDATSTIDLETDRDPLVLAPNETFVLCNSNGAEGLLARCTQRSGGLTFNGDDAVSLICGGAVLDVIGQIGTDPGRAWSNQGVTTQNATIRRGCAFREGDTDGSDAFDPAAQWLGFPQDEFEGLGAHCP
jgi:hypothetical protein